MRKKMIKCTENTVKAGRHCNQGKKSTYHTQLFPHLRIAKGKEQRYFKYLKIISQQINRIYENHISDCNSLGPKRMYIFK